jgi:hypothetical protein
MDKFIGDLLSPLAKQIDFASVAAAAIFWGLGESNSAGCW